MGNKVTVLGWYGHGNCGDESYKLTFPLVFPQYDFHFTDEIKQQHKDSDAYIMGGGDIVYSHLLQKIEKVKGKKHLISVSLSSSDCVDKLSVFDTIAVRDRASLERLEKHGLMGDLVPDMAFSLYPDRNRGAALLKEWFDYEKMELYSKVVIVVINAHLSVRHEILGRDAFTFEKFAYDMASIMDNTPASFVFIPFGMDSPHDDRITNSWVASKCKFWKKNLVVYNRLSQEDILAVYAAADAAICTRLHAGIFSTVGHTPFIDITHHDKTRSFLNTYDLSRWSLNYWSFDKDTCQEMLHKHLLDADVRQFLRKVNHGCKEALHEFGKVNLV